MATKDIKQPSELAGDMNTSSTDVHAADYFTSILNAPIGKLDADQYSAEDLDGVTEGLFGSGNLNYLMMQANQTNESMSMVDPFESPFSNTNPVSTSSTSGKLFIPNDEASRPDTSTERSIDASPPQATEINNAEGSFSNTTVGSLSASSLAVNTGAPLKVSPITSSGGGFNGDDGQSSAQEARGNNGSNGNDGADGGEGVTIINVEGDTTIDLGDIINLGDEIDLGDVTNLLTTTVTNLTDILNVTDIVDSVTNIFNDLLGDMGGITLNLDVLLSDISEGILDVSVFNIIDQTFQRALDLNPVLDVLSDNLDLADILNGALGAHITLLGGDSYLDEGDYDLLLNSDLHLAGMDLPGINLDIPLDPLEEIVGDIDIDAGAALNGVADDLLNGDLLGGDIPLDNVLGNDLLGGLGLGGDGADTDLSIDLVDTGLTDDVANVIIDPAEDLIGDIDIGGDMGLDMLGLGGNETDNNAGDTDLSLGLDIDLVDSDIIQPDIEISLDPVEDIVGDIDIDLPISFDVLGDNADDLVDNLNGGGNGDTLLGNIGDMLSDTVETIENDINIDDAIDLLNNQADLPLGDILGSGDNGDNIIAWPENNLPDAGDIIGMGDLEGGSVLPDPLGSVAEGIGILPFAQDNDPGAGGGLLGGGGLFG
jgi:hypothetical protein